MIERNHDDATTERDRAEERERRRTGRRGTASEFTDDFDYPARRLDDHGWTVVGGTVETEASCLVAEPEDSSDRVEVYREQPNATGTFEIRGVKNGPGDGSVWVDFISDAKTVAANAAGYRIRFGPDGRTTFARVDDGDVEAFVVGEDHGERSHTVRIDRDPKTYEFTVFCDGEKVLTVDDDAYTGSSYWTMAFDGGPGTRRIDCVGWDGEAAHDVVIRSGLVAV